MVVVNFAAIVDVGGVMVAAARKEDVEMGDVGGDEMDGVADIQLGEADADNETRAVEEDVEIGGGDIANVEMGEADEENETGAVEDVEMGVTDEDVEMGYVEDF